VVEATVVEDAAEVVVAVEAAATTTPVRSKHRRRDYAQTLVRTYLTTVIREPLIR